MMPKIEIRHIAPQILLTCSMLSDTLNSIAGHADLLPSGEMLKMLEIWNKMHEIQNAMH